MDVQENAGSDSDYNSDIAGDDYHPISVFDSDDDSDKQASSTGDNGFAVSTSSELFPLQNPSFRNFSNGSLENGISTLDLNNGTQNHCNSEVDEDEEEERLRQVSESAISSAFREDENRRNAPLTPENASRIIDAMRGVSFRGFPPGWTDRVPEDQWIDQLRRLRES